MNFKMLTVTNFSEKYFFRVGEGGGQAKRCSVVRRLTVGPTGRWIDGAKKPARDSNPESPDDFAAVVDRRGHIAV